MEESSKNKQRKLRTQRVIYIFLLFFLTLAFNIRAEDYTRYLLDTQVDFSVGAHDFHILKDASGNYLDEVQCVGIDFNQGGQINIPDEVSHNNQTFKVTVIGPIKPTYYNGQNGQTLVSELYINKHVRLIIQCDFGLYKFTVDKKNPYFQSSNQGILYTHDGKTLLRCKPCFGWSLDSFYDDYTYYDHNIIDSRDLYASKTDYMPDSLEHIGREAFARCGNFYENIWN